MEHARPPAYEAPPAAPSYERETVREFEPRQEAAVRETVREFEPRRELPMRDTTEPSPSAGYAPAVPVKLEWPSDLQQVESDPNKVSAVQQESVREQPAPRPKRVRQPVAPVVEEPLVQIETDRK